MKSYTSKLILCLVPVVIAAFVVARAYSLYQQGRGGFRLGVDLVGGTILVYEVDKSKLTPEALANFKPEDLAAALKRRIDPADLYNVTIRPVGGETPRVEIILPTGGRHQSQVEEAQWAHLIDRVTEQYPVAGKTDPYHDIRRGQVGELLVRITDRAKIKDKDKIQEVRAFIDSNYGLGKDRRALTGEEVENIKNLISQQGRLEFRILANTSDDGDAIARARAYFTDANNKKTLEELARDLLPPPPPETADHTPAFSAAIHGESHDYTYHWLEVGKEEMYSLGLNSQALAKDAATSAFVDGAINSGTTFSLPRIPSILLYGRQIPPESMDKVPPKERNLGKTRQYFVLTRDPLPGKEITGDYLSNAQQGQGDRGGLTVDFTFNADGGNLFYELTSLNKPEGGQNGFKRHLAIVLDGLVRSAPTLNDAIRTRGQISGDFTMKDIEALVTILRAGALPATLKPDPVSENSMGATLGDDTIRDGTRSVGYAFLAVLVFMIFYYRFAGSVACVALLANLLLTIAFMVLVKATFTLPGLAGLVLTLGMAVDANVLIYERIREERERGASLALGIRNGYDRAFPTIIDTHLSSIFTAIVLYVVGNDQLKGFGISLTVGLVISLFTSLYMTRAMFDLWLSKGWLHKLSMAHLFRRPNINFMGIRYYWFTATIILTILGAALFIWRLPSGDEKANESSVMNIDFIGGTAYTGELVRPMNITELRAKFDKLDLPDKSIVPRFGRDDKEDRASFFDVRTAEKNAADVQKKVNTILGSDLKKITLKEPVVNEKKLEAKLEFTNPETNQADFASRAQVLRLLNRAFDKHKLGIKQFDLIAPKERAKEHNERYSELTLRLKEVPASWAGFKAALDDVKTEFALYPQPERLENFDTQVASDTQQRALYAILASWAAILLYLWFRFGSWTFGAAAVLCLVHDLFFTLGMIAACHYVYASAFGQALALSDFKIDLNTVAALLTLVGYSVSDTIVVFDRIREVRGKNPVLTPQMINDSVNQTLSRTVLSSLTVWLVVIVLYIFGGEGVHLFAFVMIVGVVVGTYSSIYIASPLLLIFGEGVPAKERGRTPQAAGTPA